MIIFDKVKFKNFLATGADFNTFELNSYKSNIIIGKNGCGKSTVLDSICYALFGKPHRDINKNQLINSVNQKNCLVEIYFSVGSIQYKVVRGMKPNIFEIYQDNILINKAADVRDYQKVLEQQILKLNYKTFTQVVILGSASFTPFMQLSSGGRREVIEDILDIGIFSTMNQLNKERSIQTKEELQTTENKIKITISEIESQKRIIDNMVDNHTSQLSNIQVKKIKFQNELTELYSKLEHITSDIQDLNSKLITKDIDTLILGCNERIYKRTANIDGLKSKIKFLHDNDSCPACSQQIPNSHKDTLTESIDNEVSKVDGEITKLSSVLNELKTEQLHNSNILKNIQEKNIIIGSVKASIANINKSIQDLELEYTNIKGMTGNIDNEKIRRKELAAIGNELISKKNVLIQQKNLENISSLLLKDNGIKTSIIREYLPIMNHTINKYLDMMDFFVKFELDESFNESIKSRYRDDFSYASFSEGEKQKIDVALLLAWRNIAKLKNSVNTNILFLDEVLSTHIDSASVELLLSILDEMKKETNIFAISHTSDQFLDRFDRVIKFEKVGNFSIMTTF